MKRRRRRRKEPTPEPEPEPEPPRKRRRREDPSYEPRKRDRRPVKMTRAAVMKKARARKKAALLKMKPRRYPCARCMRSFTHRAVLNLHYRRHTKRLVNMPLLKAQKQVQMQETV